MESRYTHCHVCGDFSSNWYYGGVVCEACKKFFVRTHTEARAEYKCAKNELHGTYCVITAGNRKNCQYCRFKKCIDIGLDMNSKLFCHYSKKVFKQA
jgi:hypothetical protein